MKSFKATLLIAIGVSMLTLTGCTTEGMDIDICGLLDLSYFECLMLGG